MTTEFSMLDYALYYASIGWHIFPLKPMEKVPFSSTSGCNDASTDIDTIAAWWTRWPDANIGLRCGVESGVSVIDIDVKDGKNGFASCDKALKKLPDTVKQTTPSGGAHYICTATDPPPNKNQFLDGVDIRGQNYYIVLAPSTLEDGEYIWENPPDGKIAEFPNEFRFVRPEPTGVTVSYDPTGDYSERARAYLASVDPAIQGMDGHGKMLWAAVAMTRGFRLPEEEAFRLLASEYNPRCVPPWDLGNDRDLREFRRKVTESLRVTCNHPDGWLLTEVRDAVKDIKMRNLGDAILANILRAKEPVAVDEKPETAPAPFSLTPPGLVGDIAAWITRTSRQEQPLLALAASLTFCGSLFGRKVRDEWDLRTNLYAMAVGESCAGKDWARRKLKQLCEASGATDMLGGEDATSDAAIEKSIERNHLHGTLYLWDEIGHMMSNIKSSQSSHLKTIVPTLMKLYSSSSSVYIGKEYADGERRSLSQPCVCLYGTTVPSTLYKGISSAELRDGWLGRVLCFISTDDPEIDDTKGKCEPVPSHIVNTVKMWYDGDVNRAGVPTLGELLDVRVARTGKAANEVFREFRSKVTERKKRARGDGNGIDCLWGRAEENARKIALIVACGSDHQSLEITVDHAVWSCSMIEWCINSFVEVVKDNVSDNEEEGNKKKLLKIIREAGADGILRRDLTRKTQSLGKTRNAMLEDLIAAEYILAGVRDGKSIFTAID